MSKKISFTEIARKIEEAWRPQDVAYVNDTCLRMDKIHGTYDWHCHRGEDEFFLVMKGEIAIDFEKESVHLKEGEGVLVKRATRHRSRADKPAWVLLVEPTKTKTLGEKTK